MRINKGLTFFLMVALSISIVYSKTINAQENSINSNHYMTLKTQFNQFKDDFNYGLVFNGGDLSGRYSYICNWDKHYLSYQLELAVGANFNKGVGVAFNIIPLDIFYGYELDFDNLVLGGYFLTNYNWQMYPELQSGHMLWFSSFEFGPKVIFDLPFFDKTYKIIFSNSLFGLTSRPKPSTETYFYYLEFSDFVDNVHSNLTFGTLNTFNHSNLEIELINSEDMDFTLAYEFEYFVYYKEPGINFLSHSINFTWKLGE